MKAKTLTKNMSQEERAAFVEKIKLAVNAGKKYNKITNENGLWTDSSLFNILNNKIGRDEYGGGTSTTPWDIKKVESLKSYYFKNHHLQGSKIKRTPKDRDYFWNKLNGMPPFPATVETAVVKDGGLEITLKDTSEDWLSMNSIKINNHLKLALADTYLAGLYDNLEFKFAYPYIAISENGKKEHKKQYELPGFLEGYGMIIQALSGPIKT